MPARRWVNRSSAGKILLYHRTTFFELAVWVYVVKQQLIELTRKSKKFFLVWWNKLIALHDSTFIRLTSSNTFYSASEWSKKNFWRNRVFALIFSLFMSTTKCMNTMEKKRVEKFTVIIIRIGDLWTVVPVSIFTDRRRNKTRKKRKQVKGIGAVECWNMIRFCELPTPSAPI